MEEPEKLLKKNILHIQDVVKFYGAKVVLYNVDLSIQKGEFCSVVGPSGCGKSTLLKIILGQERATEGDVYIEGEPAGYPNPKRGVVYQRYGLYPNMTVLESVMLTYKFTHSPLERWKKRKQFTDEAMMYIEKVKLGEHFGKMPHELSGGMQQRVAIAQALITRPKILLMDEPYGALDVATRECLQTFQLELWKEYNMTILNITHDVREAVYMSTRVIVLSQYYWDGRKPNGNFDHGSRIVADYPICRDVFSTKIKETPEFNALASEIKNTAFGPEYVKHVTEFNLKHPDSFQTLTPEECRKDPQP
jgi:NitT/TauT family transport system ATP-binding protein